MDIDSHWKWAFIQVVFGFAAGVGQAGGGFGNYQMLNSGDQCIPPPPHEILRVHNYSMTLYLTLVCYDD